MGLVEEGKSIQSNAIHKEDNKYKGPAAGKSLEWMKRYKEVFGVRRPTWLEWAKKGGLGSR